MNSKSIVFAWFGILIAIVIAVGSLLVNVGALKFGASGTRYPNGLSADNTSPVAGQVRGTTLNITSTSNFSGDAVFGGGLSGINITSTNAATSSIKVGCIESYATSTLTPIRLSATTTASGGTMPLWVFGSCSAL